MAKLTDEQIRAICAAEIAASVDYDKTEYRESRERALQYFLGDMPDTPAEEGRSKAKTSTTADVVEWILPGLMRVFFGSDRMVDYEPDSPADEAFADQASDYVNFVFERDGDGYKVLWDAFHDALVTRKGVVKFWWDEKPIYTTETYSNLSDDTMAMVLAEDEVEVLAHSAVDAIDETGQPIALHDVKLRRIKHNGQICLASVPPEDFGINPGANSICEARFIWQRVIKTRSDLIEDGYDKKLIMSLPRSQGDFADHDEIRLARDEDFIDIDVAHQDKSTEEVEIYECYLKADIDGDGISEWITVCMAGRQDGQILHWEEWGDPIPFVELDPMRVPHRWLGRSIADSTMDVQQISTVLLRQTLDNIYEQNHPQKVVVESQILNPDEVINPKFNGVIRVKNDIGAVQTLVPTFVAENTFGMLSYLDDLVERRTGVSRSTMALDAEALQNQTATATNAAQSAQYSKVEMIARNFALGGLRDLFRGLLKIVVAHQDRPRTIKLRDKWVEMDPRGWNAEMDVTINTGLGTGSRERDMAMLMQVLGIQREIIAGFGPDNGMVKPQQLYNTVAKLVEAAGIRNVDLFFTEMSDEEVQARMQAAAEQPDPKMQAEMARLQMEQQKAQADMQAKREEAAFRLQFDREKAAADLQLMRERASAELQIMREKAAAEMQIRREEMAIEAELTAEANRMNAAVAARKADTNVTRPE